MDRFEMQLRLEVKIPQLRIIEQLQTNNIEMQAVVQRAFEDAFDDLLSSDRLYHLMKDEIKIAIQNEMRHAVSSWNIKEKVTKIVADSLTSKIEDYAKVISETLLGGLTDG